MHIVATAAPRRTADKTSQYLYSITFIVTFSFRDSFILAQAIGVLLYPCIAAINGQFNIKKYLCASHTNLWASIDVHSAVCLSANGTSHSVSDTHHKGALRLAVPQGVQRVCRLPCRRSRYDN